jgi:RNA exonuclease 1
LDGVSTSMSDVHNTLRRLISPRTIIVGHSLDCDLRALCLTHSRVIDTAALFPHPKGTPFKHSLKKLALDFLHRVVQADSKSAGHDSIQGKVV